MITPGCRGTEGEPGIPTTDRKRTLKAGHTPAAVGALMEGTPVVGQEHDQPVGVFTQLGCSAMPAALSTGVIFPVTASVLM